jgi:hypothetical protein
MESLIKPYGGLLTDMTDRTHNGRPGTQTKKFLGKHEFIAKVGCASQA